MTLLVVPTKAQVFKKNLFDEKKYDLEKPNRIVKRFCQHKKIYCINLLEEYKKISERLLERFYYKRDLHWTARGHWFAAHILLDGFEHRREF